MELNTKLVDNKKVDYVIKSSGALAKDVISAYNLFCDNNSELTDVVNKRLDRVYFMCRYLDAEVEDIISMLLFHDYLVNKITAPVFQRTFNNEKRSVRYFEYMNDARTFAPKDTSRSRDECVSYYIMILACDKLMQKLVRELNKKGVSNTGLISNAYSLAKEANKWSYCEWGVPSVIHSIAVAGILAEFGAESPIIAAALLHSSVASGKCKLTDVFKACRVSIVPEYIEAVISVENDYSAAKIGGDSADLDVKRVENLVKNILAERKMMLALHIKAAETVYELQKIDPEEITEIHDSESSGYPVLLETFKLEYFCSKINDLVFCARDYTRYSLISQFYKDMISKNRDCINEIRKLLTVTDNMTVFSELFKGKYAVELRESFLSPVEVFNCIKEAGFWEDDTGKTAEPASWVNKRNVPICNFDLIFEPLNEELTIKSFMSAVAKLFERRSAATGATIIDVCCDEHDRPIYMVEDRYHNIYRCRISTRKQDFKLHNGFEMSSEPGAADEVEPAAKNDKIIVRLRNDKRISLPKGSTVIDLAYAIHEDLGRTLKGATINDKKAGIYTILYDGDKIVIDADTAKNCGREMEIPHVRISWLKHVVTKRAKNKIIDFLIYQTPKIEGNDQEPLFMVADDERVSTIVDSILASCSGFPKPTR